MTTEVHSEIEEIEQSETLLDEDKRYELVEGELLEMPGPNFSHGRITARLVRYLGNYVAESNSVEGEVLTNTSFKLGPKNELLPDVAFVTAERLDGVDYSEPFPGAPDLAIEVNSPSDTVERIYNKLQAYLNANTQLIWSIYPLDKIVLVYRSGDKNPRLVVEENELDGEDVIPGFKLKLDILFQ